MKEKKSFGYFITAKRKELGYTQRELAEKLFVTESAISKWERGLSYPDISMITALCEALGVSEHELITASEDVNQKHLEKEAKQYRRLRQIYQWSFYLLYATALLTCFICNLAVNHTLSWFFVVFASLLFSFTLTSLPLLIQKHRALITFGSSFVALNLLLYICCVYTLGDWFFVTFIAILFSASVLFMPFVLRSIPLPPPLCHHRTVFTFAINTILLFVLLFCSLSYAGCPELFVTIACPIALYFLPLPWGMMIIIRYLHIHPFFRASLCCLLWSVFIFVSDGIVGWILYRIPMTLPTANLLVWNLETIDGNVLWICFLTCIFVAIGFAIAAMVTTISKAKGDKEP